jgi:hypothetical protein
MDVSPVILLLHSSGIQASCHNIKLELSLELPFTSASVTYPEEDHSENGITYRSSQLSPELDEQREQKIKWEGRED